MAAILFYEQKDPYYEFSNFYLAEITIDGIKYPSTEYYYQAQKFMGPDATPADLAYAKVIRSTNTSNKAFYLARQIARGGYTAGWYVSAEDKTLLNDIIKQSHKDGVKPRDDWELVKDNVMRKALWAKFTQHSKLKDLLTNTGKKKLVENSPRDSYWGVGKDKGQNMLGRILEEIRTFLTGKYPKAPTNGSNWIIPEFLLASAYPGAKSSKEHKKIIDALMEADINLFLSLQEAQEDAKFNSYRKIIAPKFESTGSGFCDRVKSKPYSNKSVIFARIPIKDRQVVSDDYLDLITDALVKGIGKHFHMLVHCFGGKGRTGTVIAVMLGKMYGMTADQVLGILSDSFASRVTKGKQKPSMPQTKAQFEQVRRMLSLQGPKNKLAIVGSRNFNDYDLFVDTIDDSLGEWELDYEDIAYIVSGGAQGADSLAAKFASENGIPLKEYLPDWEQYGKAAGPIRNKKIIADATHVIAFPSHTGSGTQNSISLAKKANLPLKVLYITAKAPVSKKAPTVICIKKDELVKQGYSNFQDWLDQDPNHLYIGRNMTYYVPGTVASKWKNPYPVKTHGLAQALEMYEQHVRDSPELMSALPELGDKVLGCWCKDSACHGDTLVKLYNEQVLKIGKAPASKKALGKVRIGKKRARGVTGEKNPEFEGFKNIDVTSGSGNKISGRSVKLDMSPMLIGPVTDSEMTAKKFENYWQYGKVFPNLGHVDANGDPTVVWYAFRKKGYAKEKADRHAEGTKSNQVAFVDEKGHNHYKYYQPAFAVYDGERYDYIQSRKKVYVPMYAQLIKNTNTFKELKKMVDAGQNIQILDLDGPHDGDVLGKKSHLVTVDLLKEKINDPKAPFGHGYVVAALLAGIEPEEYID